VLRNKSSQVLLGNTDQNFIATFKTLKRKQRKTIQSPSQPHLYSITASL